MKCYLSLISVLLALCFLSVNCGKNSEKENKKSMHESDISITYACAKVDSLFLSELKNRRILMINDANHGHGYFMLRVTDFLNHWLNKISTDSALNTLPRKIVLFLECNKDIEQTINQYIMTGDLYSFLKTNIEFDLEAGSNVFTIDYMIFINELKKISKRINKLNEEEKTSRIEFKICGAESDPPFYKKLFEMDPQHYKKEKEIWYVKRDKICSDNIQSFLKLHPEYKALVFYGGVHLLRSKANKSFDKDELDPEIYDYYLSYYLDSIFGRENVSVFWYTSNPWVELEKVEKIGIHENMPDYIIYSKPVPSAPLPFSFAKTQTYLKALYDILLKYVDSKTALEAHLAKYACIKLNNAILRTRHDGSQKINQQFKALALSKNKKSEAAKFVNLAEGFINKYNVIDGINNISESINYSDYPDSMVYNRELYLMLTNITNTQFDWPRQNLNHSAFRKLLLAKSKNINDDMDKISQYIAIHQFFIATKDEKESVLKYLNEGINFKGKSDNIWMNWLYNTIKSESDKF